MDHGGCQELAEVACELALGILTGPKRARALNHLEACGRCRRLVAELTKASDAVIAFAPQAEPPAGFETRVLDRMAMSGVERTADLSMMGDLSIGQERR
ncbi:MAG: hypothetical protein ACRD0E_11820, partial [Acidimicrobiales bacterium]